MPRRSNVSGVNTPETPEFVIHLDELELPPHSAVTPLHFRAAVEAELARLVRAGVPRGAGRAALSVDREDGVTGGGLAARVARAIHQRMYRMA